MAKDYFTKCGLKFSKSSNSGVTGYEYPEDKPECKSCPFAEVVDRQRECVPVKVKQCQAGEKKPNHWTECGSVVCTDTNNLHIQTLDLTFIADLEIFIKELPGIQCHYFNALDNNDCRKSYVVGFEKNKKGLTAKKAIIDKFFSGGKSFEKYVPEKRPMDEASVKELPEEMEYKAKCPYLSSMGDKYIQCSLHAAHKGRPEFPSQGALNDHTKNICYCDFDKCEIYQATYKEEMESTEKYILERHECAFCCNNSHYTGLKEHDGSTHGFCQLWQEDKELFNSNTVCEWFNKKYRPQESGKTEQKDNDSKENKDVDSESLDNCLGCINSKNDKCSIKGVNGGALVHFVMDDGVPDCDTMRKLKVDYLKGERKCGHAHSGCAAVNHLCSLKGEYCCYTCKEPCNSCCDWSKELVPYGKLKPDDKGLIQADKPAYIFTMDIEEDQETALNSHLQYVRKKSEDIVGNYVEIGFALISVRNNKLFRARGYGNLVDCVGAELNMKKSTAYNLIKIAEKFGDPETKKLRPEYSKFNYVQCLEMSTMTKEELAQTNPEMSKREMKQLKNSNRLENSDENNDPDVKSKGRGQLIEEPGRRSENSNVIEVTEYKVVEDEKTEGRQLLDPDPVHPIEIQETESRQDQEPPQPDNTSNVDKYINDLLLENESFRLRIEDLEKDKATFRELVGQIDSKFDKLTKKQIRSSLWDFISTGMIMFEEQ